MLTQHISWGSTNINKWDQALDSGDSIDHNNLLKQSKNKVEKIRERLGQQSLSAKANQITEILVKTLDDRGDSEKWDIPQIYAVYCDDSRTMKSQEQLNSKL